MSQESLTVKLCNCLETLITGKKAESSPNKCYPKDKREAIFYELRKNVHFAFEVIEKCEDLKLAVKQYIVICHKKKCKTCNYLNFLELILVLLKLLSASLLSEENEQDSNKQAKASVPKGMLSISQQKIVKKTLQFVVALGILPNLLRGIGVPLTKRLEYAEMLEHFASDISPRQKHAQIAICVETLLCCAERSSLQGIILSYHGTDLLAALFQLCHAPIKKIENKNDSEFEDCKVISDIHQRYFTLKLSLVKDFSSFTDQQLINEMVLDRNYFIPKLQTLLKQICPSLLLWELLLFQGIPIRCDDSEFTISKVPVWLRKICSQMLTDMILQNNGIASFVQVILDKAYDVDVERGIVDNVRLDAVARLIVYNPVRHIPLEDYIRRLSKQVLDLLRLTGSPMDTLLHYVASSIILHVCDRDTKSAEKYFLETLFQPLWMCVSTTSDTVLCDSKIIVPEKVLSICLEDIHKIFVQSNSPLSRKHIKLLFPFFHCFSHMYFFLLEGVSILKSEVKNLLLNILSSANNEDAISLLHTATFSSINDKGTLVYMTTVCFAYGEDGGIGAVKHYKENYSDFDINCRAILGLLTELKNKDLNKSFFLLVFKVFCSCRNEILKDPDDSKYKIKFQNLSALIQELLLWDIGTREDFMSNVSEVMDIVMVLLEITEIWEDGCDETIRMVLMVLSTLLFGNDEQLSSTQWTVLKKCLPCLEKLMKKPINSDIKDGLFRIITYISTHGVAGGSSFKEEVMQKCISELCQHSSETMRKEDSANSSDSKNSKSESVVCPNLEDAFADLTSTNSSDRSSELASDLELRLKMNQDLNKKIDEYTFGKAIQCIKDSSIPIKGRGLIAVRKLLSNRDGETLCYKKELLEIFLLQQESLEQSIQMVTLGPKYYSVLILFWKILQFCELKFMSDVIIVLEQVAKDLSPQIFNMLTATVYGQDILYFIKEEALNNDDTYVYLSAIKCLLKLACIDVQLVLPEVLKVYRNPGDKNTEFILKAGEVLLQIYRSLGDCLYEYKDEMLHTYLIGAKHEDPQIRSSSLSNLGEACKYLKFSISIHLQEILCCVLTLLKTDKDLEVRRSAAMVITLLLEGVGKDLFRILGNEIRDIYRQMNIVYTSESDDALCHHLQQALGKIDAIMMKELLEQRPLTKEIRIVH